MKRATAYANANIALVKYWGKSESVLNIPAVSSLSMTLSNLGTKVSLSHVKDSKHVCSIDGRLASFEEAARLTMYLELVRQHYPYKGFLQVASKSTVLFQAGLASSASFYAALAQALNDYLDLHLDHREISILARIGSGSAARSIFPGFVGLYGGQDINHNDAYAFSIETHPHLDLALVIAIINEKPKAISSREAMNLTKKTSPLFAAFVASHSQDFIDATRALKAGLFEQLGCIMEHSTLKMYATMWTARPAINYWHPTTLALFELVYQLRQSHGPKAFFTMDAGANVKILCPMDFIPTVLSTLTNANLTSKLYTSLPGEGVKRLDDHLL
jgi:diphosphomevalonate decarboxylase